jgi:hypothetical protein
MKRDHSDIETVNEALRVDREQNPTSVDYHLGCATLLGFWVFIVGCFLFLSKILRVS